MESFYRRPLCGRDGGAIEPLALRPREAAAAIGVSPETLVRLTKAGEIASVKAGRCRLYEVAELKAYFARKRAGGQA